MDLNRAHQSSVGHCRSGDSARPVCQGPPAWPMVAYSALLARLTVQWLALMTTLTLSITHCTDSTQECQYTTQITCPAQLHTEIGLTSDQMILFNNFQF